jgi:hypothetical protein
MITKIRKKNATSCVGVNVRKILSACRIALCVLNMSALYAFSNQNDYLHIVNRVYKPFTFRLAEMTWPIELFESLTPSHPLTI